MTTRGELNGTCSNSRLLPMARARKLSKDMLNKEKQNSVRSDRDATSCKKTQLAAHDILWVELTISIPSSPWDQQ